MHRRLLLLSTSTVHGGRYLEYCAEDLRAFLKGIQRILFVPYARPSGLTHDAYTWRVQRTFEPLGVSLTGIHEAPDPVRAVTDAEALFVGGGNTFLLLTELYRAGVMETIRARAAAGMPYVGTSAGSNIAGITIGTSNDMPIAYPPSYDALRLVPFNLNPHYLDPDPTSTHMGETRETRIKEFHRQNSQAVVGLREGAGILVEGDRARLTGANGGRLFRQGLDPVELHDDADLSALL